MEQTVVLERALAVEISGTNGRQSEGNSKQSNPPAPIGKGQTDSGPDALSILIW